MSGRVSRSLCFGLQELELGTRREKCSWRLENTAPGGRKAGSGRGLVDSYAAQGNGEV